MKRFWLSWTRLQTYGFAASIIAVIFVINDIAHRTDSIIVNILADVAMLLLGGLEAFVIFTNATRRDRDSEHLND